MSGGKPGVLFRGRPCEGAEGCVVHASSVPRTVPRRAAPGRWPRHRPHKGSTVITHLRWRRMGGPRWETVMEGAPRRGASREGHFTRQTGGGDNVSP